MKHYIQYDGEKFNLISEESNIVPPCVCELFECEKCGLLKPSDSKLNFNGSLIQIPDHFFQCEVTLVEEEKKNTIR